MKDIKLVAWDVYGTIISSYVRSPDKRELRPNALELIETFRSYGIPQVTSSDADTERIKDLFNELGVDQKYFDRMYKMTPGQKDYSPIKLDYNLNPKNILVIGNSPGDITPAKKLGCQTLFVPEKFPFQGIPKGYLNGLKFRCFFEQDIPIKMPLRSQQNAKLNLS